MKPLFGVLALNQAGNDCELQWMQSANDLTERCGTAKEHIAALKFVLAFMEEVNTACPEMTTRAGMGKNLPHRERL